MSAKHSLVMDGPDNLNGYGLVIIVESGSLPALMSQKLFDVLRRRRGPHRSFRLIGSEVVGTVVDAAKKAELNATAVAALSSSMKYYSRSLRLPDLFTRLLARIQVRRLRIPTGVCSEGHWSAPFDETRWRRGDEVFNSDLSDSPFDSGSYFMTLHRGRLPSHLHLWRRDQCRGRDAEPGSSAQVDVVVSRDALDPSLGPVAVSPDFSELTQRSQTFPSCVPPACPPDRPLMVTQGANTPTGGGSRLLRRARPCSSRACQVLQCCGQGRGRTADLPLFRLADKPLTDRRQSIALWRWPSGDIPDHTVGPAVGAENLSDPACRPTCLRQT